MTFQLDGYTTVADRILDFYKQYPAGVITTLPAKHIELGSSLFVSVIARVYLDRHMDDAPMTEAEAWEPYPGKTPYTRDSEMMNAATSAIGRALMQLGIGITAAGAASADEIRVAQERRGDANTFEPIRNPRIAGSALSEAQMEKLVKPILKRNGLEDIELARPALSALLGRPINSLDDLVKADVDPIKNAGPTDWAKARLSGSGITITSIDVEEDPWGGKPW